MRIGELIAWAIAAGIVWLLIYGVGCWWWPYKSCRKCEGAGKFRSPSGKAWRNCRRCKGSGSRIRRGRRVWRKLAVAKDKLVG